MLYPSAETFILKARNIRYIPKPINILLTVLWFIFLSQTFENRIIFYQKRKSVVEVQTVSVGQTKITLNRRLLFKISTNHGH